MSHVIAVHHFQRHDQIRFLHIPQINREEVLYLPLVSSVLEWYFRGFCDELSPWLRYIQPLPQKPSYYTAKRGAGFHPDWPIRGLHLKQVLYLFRSYNFVSLPSSLCSEGIPAFIPHHSLGVTVIHGYDAFLIF